MVTVSVAVTDALRRIAGSGSVPSVVETATGSPGVAPVIVTGVVAQEPAASALPPNDPDIPDNEPQADDDVQMVEPPTELPPIKFVAPVVRLIDRGMRAMVPAPASSITL